MGKKIKSYFFCYFRQKQVTLQAEDLYTQLFLTICKHIQHIYLQFLSTFFTNTIWA